MSSGDRYDAYHRNSKVCSVLRDVSSCLVEEGFLDGMMNSVKVHAPNESGGVEVQIKSAESRKKSVYTPELVAERWGIGLPAALYPYFKYYM